MMNRYRGISVSLTIRLDGVTNAPPLAVHVVWFHSIRRTALCCASLQGYVRWGRHIFFYLLLFASLSLHSGLSAR